MKIKLKNIILETIGVIDGEKIRKDFQRKMYNKNKEKYHHLAEKFDHRRLRDERVNAAKKIYNTSKQNTLKDLDIQNKREIRDQMVINSFKQ